MFYGASNMVLTYGHKLEISNWKTLINYIYIYIFSQTQKYSYIIFQLIANTLNNKILLVLTENKFIYLFIYVFQFYNTMGCLLRNKSFYQITWIVQLFLVCIWKYECNFTMTKETLSIWIYLEIFMLLLVLQQTIITDKKLSFHRSAVYSNKLTFKGTYVWKF